MSKAKKVSGVKNKKAELFKSGKDDAWGKILEHMKDLPGEEYIPVNFTKLGKAKEDAVDQAGTLAQRLATEAPE